ncbi:alpha/beta fold hydrolase [Flocculibacter collagenilyticus]|uniref:alpha/beta fold hydrolase n=1 Tax=Flocculibacter collagenilyticus TaxID=2744479 RepID=UPI001F322985|nr:alpha/beta fold hydrolase [Flocculibacter collagenilyticus]
MIKQRSLFIDCCDDHQQSYQLHLRHIAPEGKASSPVLMVHGAIENGKIFYTHKGKGVGCFLARQGFDVYVLDLRGRGQSTPAISSSNKHGQFNSIAQQIPIAMNYIHQLNSNPIHLVGHSWGGIMLTSTLVRYPDLANMVSTKLFFGTKRSISVSHLKKRLMIDVLWNGVAPLLSKVMGYLPAKQLQLGSDNETYDYLKESRPWVNGKPWKDVVDGFDYEQAAIAHQDRLSNIPVWHFAAVDDHVLGHPVDVKRFQREAQQEHGKYTLLGKAQGNLADYDHITMLTHPKCEQDHFPQIAKWMLQLSH